MTPRKIRELLGLTDAYVAAGMSLGLGTLQLLEATPVSAWKVADLALYAKACGHTLKIIAVDGHGVERVVT